MKEICCDGPSLTSHVRSDEKLDVEGPKNAALGISSEGEP